MTPKLEAIIGELATLSTMELSAKDLEPYKEVLKNLEIIYPVDKGKIIERFNKSRRNALAARQRNN